MKPGFKKKKKAVKEFKIKEQDEFDTRKNSISDVNKKNYNALMSKLKTNPEFNTFKRKKSRFQVSLKKENKKRAKAGLSINSNKNSRKKIDRHENPEKRRKTHKARLNNAKLEPKSYVMKYKTGKKNRMERMVNNIMKQKDWVDTQFQKARNVGVVPQKPGKSVDNSSQKRRAKSSKKRTDSARKRKRKQKRRNVNSVAAKQKKKSRANGDNLEDDWTFNSNVFNQ